MDDKVKMLADGMVRKKSALNTISDELENHKMVNKGVNVKTDE